MCVCLCILPINGARPNIFRTCFKKRPWLQNNGVQKISKSSSAGLLVQTSRKNYSKPKFDSNFCDVWNHFHWRAFDWLFIPSCIFPEPYSNFDSPEWSLKFHYSDSGSFRRPWFSDMFESFLTHGVFKHVFENPGHMPINKVGPWILDVEKAAPPFSFFSFPFLSGCQFKSIWQKWDIRTK